MILSSNKTGVETGALAAAKATDATYRGYTHKPDEVSRIFDMETMEKVFEVSKRLIEEADFVIYIGPYGGAYRKLKKRAGKVSVMRIDCKKVTGLADVPLKNKRVYITGVREQQCPGIMRQTFDALKANLRKQP